MLYQFHFEQLFLRELLYYQNHHTHIATIVCCRVGRQDEKIYDQKVLGFSGGNV